MNISKTEIEVILNRIKTDDNEIHWSFFVSEAKEYIISSWNTFANEGQCRASWMRFFKDDEVSKFGCQAKTGLDNWFIVQKQQAALLTASTSSTSMPPLSTMSSSSKSTRRSSLGTVLSEQKRQRALNLYKSMDNDKKWRLVCSGRYVENVMADVVRRQRFEHPSDEFVVLDLTDKNWQEEFTKQEKDEISSLIPSTITYPPIPDDMIDFLKAIPNTVDLPAIFNHLESTPLNYQSQKHLLWLKYSVLNAIYLIDNHYLPISDQSCGIHPL